MKFLILLMFGFSFGPIISGLLEPVVGVVEETVTTVGEDLGIIQADDKDTIYITSGLTTTLGTQLHKETIGTIEENNSEASKERIKNLAETTNIELKNNEKDVTNKDNIVRPCDLDDSECIRNFLGKNSNCTPTSEPIPDPLNSSQQTIIASAVDITVTFGSVISTGLSSAKIVEFYENKKTRNVVIAFEITNLKEIAHTFFSYHRPAKESIVLDDKTTVLFTSLTLTIIIPGPYLRLDLAQAHVFFNDVIPPFTIGPGLAASLDPAVVLGFASIVPNVRVIIKELFLTKAQLYSALIVQSCLCDFGVPLYSV